MRGDDAAALLDSREVAELNLSVERCSRVESDAKKNDRCRSTCGSVGLRPARFPRSDVFLTAGSDIRLKCSASQERPDPLVA
jgi:hypothetical protein